ncbi:phage virion morphogenesis protein [Sphingobacterium luzhongxinii]|uniref:phage virion morphogenesis protein n=1 Tax=Sphingobacterium luzhongxinii TaxID=2654181 RepID=UPI0013DBE46E|nr:phage virion morphogenesis protein [Sphingobacterium sp. xlx-73]
MSNQQNIDAFFQNFLQKVEAVNQRLPDIIGTEVINSTLDNFKDESFFGQKWPARKDKKNTRKLLIKTGTLQRSPRIVRSQPGLVTVGSDVPYAAVHNNGEEINRAARSETFIRNRYKTGKKGKMFGGMGAFRNGTTLGQGQTYKAYSYSMPMRKFLGSHPKLKAKLEQTIRDEFITELKSI